MPDRLGAQRDLLGRLLDAADADQAIRWIELGGSLARDAGDELSEIDAGLGIDDARWPDWVEAIVDIIRQAGQVADEFRQPFGRSDGRDGWHLFTLYASGLQLSLVVIPATQRAGLPPQSVALYDIDGQLARSWTPDVAVATAQTAREWACLAWLALSDLMKYLDRGSAWEALSRLDEARSQAWKLWAVAIGASYPAFGLTSVLDIPEPSVPPGIEATVAGLDPLALRTAATAMTAVLDQVTSRAQAGNRFHPPVGLRAWAHRRLRVPGSAGYP